MATSFTERIESAIQEERRRAARCSVPTAGAADDREAATRGIGTVQQLSAPDQSSTGQTVTDDAAPAEAV